MFIIGGVHGTCYKLFQQSKGFSVSFGQGKYIYKQKNKDKLRK